MIDKESPFGFPYMRFKSIPKAKPKQAESQDHPEFSRVFVNFEFLFLSFFPFPKTLIVEVDLSERESSKVDAAYAVVLVG